MRRLLGCLSCAICAHLLLATITTSRPVRTECPAISIETPSNTICPLAKVTFTAGVIGGANGQPNFRWTVSAGKIIGGQGTRTITVATVDEYGHSVDDSVTATVEVPGLGTNCSNNASFTVRVEPFCPERKFDEYGDLPFAEEKVRLESFIDRLHSDKDTLGLIVVCAAEHQRASEAEARAERSRHHLVNERGFDADRIITKEGGTREALTVELWVMPTRLPPRADSPTANSTLTPLNPAPPKQTNP